MITLLTSKNILTTKAFYQSLGLQLIEEKHGDGPTHFSINLKNTLFEIYPQSPSSTSHTIFMTDVPNLQTCLTQIPLLGGKILEPISEKNNSLRLLAQDPDGRILRLTQITT